jgi:hypothetical protein
MNMTNKNNSKLYLPRYADQEGEGTPILLQQHMSQGACWKGDVQYQGAGKKKKILYSGQITELMTVT